MRYWVRSLLQDLALSNQTELNKEEFWALKDVSFAVEQGEILGVIGRNGSGKSTLLQMISGLVKPSYGNISAPENKVYLSNYDSGFQSKLTGRENIQLQCLLHGMDRREIKNSYKSIEEYSELSDSLDSPFMSYSSGMRARLGFSIAMHLNPDMLIIDEALVVGDEKFREKCYQTIQKQSKEKICLFASHSMSDIKSMCTKVIWLDEGRVRAYGNVVQVIRDYQNFLQLQSDQKKEVRPTIQPSGFAVVSRVLLNEEALHPGMVVDCGSDLMIALSYVLCAEIVKKYFVRFILVNKPSQYKYTIPSNLSELEFNSEQREFHLTINVPKNSIDPSQYQFRIEFVDQETLKVNDKLVLIDEIRFENRSKKISNRRLACDWKEQTSGR